MNGTPARSMVEAARGQVITADLSEYNEARAVDNGMIDRRSFAILRAVDVADVQIGVNAVRESGLLLAVRNRAHRIPGLGNVDDGIVLDLSATQALGNCEAVLRAGGAGTDEIVEVGVLPADPTDFAEINDLGALVPRGTSRTLRHQARRRASRRGHLDPDDGTCRGRRVVPCI